MPKRIYVGNLPLDTKENDVRDLFGEFGTVEFVKIGTPGSAGFEDSLIASGNPPKGRKGLSNVSKMLHDTAMARPKDSLIAYVQMTDETTATKAVHNLKNKLFKGRKLDFEVPLF
jgi:RNA recognition motif-containing protein